MWVFKNVQNYPIGCSLSQMMLSFFPDVKAATGTRFRVWDAGTNALRSLVVRLSSFMLFPWTRSGVAWPSASRAHRIQSGSPTNPYPPLEYGGSGPDWKGEASR